MRNDQVGFQWKVLKRMEQQIPIGKQNAETTQNKIKECCHSQMGFEGISRQQRRLQQC
jgi:hypothetical protein